MKGLKMKRKEDLYAAIICLVLTILIMYSSCAIAKTLEVKITGTLGDPNSNYYKIATGMKKRYNYDKTRLDLANPLYQPLTIVNPAYDANIPATIPNPEYDPNVPESQPTIPNPAYEPPTLPNPAYDANIPATVQEGTDDWLVRQIKWWMKDSANSWWHEKKLQDASDAFVPVSTE
jgi:hypothetical protein